MTYIDDARTALTAELPDLDPALLDLDPALLDLDLLLTLVKGGGVTLAEVHDAWAVWRSHSNPQHQSIVPFGELSFAVQALDRPYAEGIATVARKLHGGVR